MPIAAVLLVPLCFVLLALSGLVIRHVPWRRLSRWLGNPARIAHNGASTTPRQARAAACIGRSIALAARFAPFRADCYPQALTAVLLGRALRVPTAAYFGARFELRPAVPRRLEGHVWVTSGERCICGSARSFQTFPIVACFVRPGRP